MWWKTVEQEDQTYLMEALLSRVKAHLEEEGSSGLESALEKMPKRSGHTGYGLARGHSRHEHRSRIGECWFESTVSRVARRPRSPSRRNPSRWSPSLAVESERHLGRSAPPESRASSSASAVGGLAAVPSVQTTTVVEPPGPGDNIHQDSHPIPVWIIGHSYVRRAEIQARSRPMGVNLGVVGATVTWRGVGGMQWNMIMDEVVTLLGPKQDRGVLILHAGGNDLGTVKTAVLIPLIKADLERIHRLYPNVCIVWSDIVSRKTWRGARSWEGLERARKTVNIRIGRFVRYLGGLALRHKVLESRKENTECNGVQFDMLGVEILLSDLQDGLETAICLVEGRWGS